MAGARPYARRPARHRPVAGRAGGALCPPGRPRRGLTAAAPGRRSTEPDHPGADPVAPASVLAVADLPGAAVRLAGCCTPVPPDAVTGFAVRGGTVTVHRALCPVVARMAATGRQPVGVRWRGAGQGGHGCRVTLLAEAFCRPQLLADLTEVIASQGAAVVSAAVEPRTNSGSATPTRCICPTPPGCRP